MELHIAQIEWQGYRVISLPVASVIESRPLPDWPHGRKALGMARLWDRLSAAGSPGVLWMDHDVAADPDDLDAMAEAVRARPADMHTGMVKLWPRSTGRPDWIWSHRPGRLGFPLATQREDTGVAYVAAGFLWTPARLLQLAAPELPELRWEQVDVHLSEVALRHAIPAHAVRNCRPKHLHY